MFSGLNFFEGGGAAAAVSGGNGRSFDEEYSFFLGACINFLGIPGNCSQENGTPEYLRGVAGLSGESSGKEEDPSEEEHGESDDEEENDGVRRDDKYFVAGTLVSHSLETTCGRLLRVAEESITV